MLGRKLLRAVRLIMPAAAVLMTQATFVEAASEECRTKPDLSAPVGNSHWHYRVDRINQRRCWFLSSGDSRMRHTSSLRRREVIGPSIESEIEEQSKLDGRTVAGPTSRQEALVLPAEPELATPELDSLWSDELVPHKVTLISFAQPRIGEQNLRPGTNFDLVFLCGALATALLVAGGVVQVIDRFHRRPRAVSAKPALTFRAKRSSRNALSSKGTKLNELRERLSRPNIPAPQTKEMLLLSALKQTTPRRTFGRRRVWTEVKGRVWLIWRARPSAYLIPQNHQLRSSVKP
jgi:hypothetical protein